MYGASRYISRSVVNEQTEEPTVGKSRYTACV